MGRQPWYSLHWPRSKERFEVPNKILVQAIRNLALKRRVVATIDEDKLYADHTLNVIYPNSEDMGIKALLGILNSSLINFYFSKKFIDINIKGVYLADIPIPSIKQKEALYKEISTNVQQLLDLWRASSSGKDEHHRIIIRRQIEATDRQIDQLVYKLYDLTPDEIKIVEGSE